MCCCLMIFLFWTPGHRWGLKLEQSQVAVVIKLIEMDRVEPRLAWHGILGIGSQSWLGGQQIHCCSWPILTNVGQTVQIGPTWIYDILGHYTTACARQYLNLDESCYLAVLQDGTFNYDAPIWQDGASSTFGTGATYQNTKTEALKRRITTITMAWSHGGIKSQVFHWVDQSWHDFSKVGGLQPIEGEESEIGRWQHGCCVLLTCDLTAIRMNLILTLLRLLRTAHESPIMVPMKCQVGTSSEHWGRCEVSLYITGAGLCTRLLCISGGAVTTRHRWVRHKWLVV